MHSHRLLAPHILVDQNGLFRVDMGGFHDVSGEVGADGDDCQVERTVYLSDLLENLTVGSISWVENLLPLRSLYHKSSP